jgi:hypothetical protein
MSSSHQPDWASLIPDAPFDWALIPLDGHKCPIDPSTGQPMAQWQEQPGYDVDGLAQLNGCVKAAGLILGPPSGGVLAVDFDGPDAPAKFQEAYGRPATALPPTVGVTSGKPCRGQRLFQVDPDWWPHLRGRHVWKQNGEVCLELRWAGHQSVIAGAHPETKGYIWLPQSSPAEREVAMAPEWLLEPLLRSEAHAEAIEPSSDDAKRAIAMLQHIDPLSRTDYDSWIEVGMALFHTDPGLLADWVSWSKAMPNFDEAECLSKWESFGSKTGSRLTIRSLHHWAKAGGYQEPKRARPQQSVVQEQGADLTDPLDEWENTLRTLVDPAHPSFEKNIIRRQIRAATAASEYPLRVSHDQIRARLIQKQRELLAGTDAKGVEGGSVARFAEKLWLISNLIAEGCLTGIAAFAKVGKTKCLTEVAASLIFQQPFMGNPDWQPAPGPHKLILWWTDQPGVDSAAYLKARGLMEPDGTLHPQIVKLYTQEDNLCWDDQGMDELICITTANPDAALLTDSFYANVQPIYGSDQAPESGGALIDVQTFASRYTKAHICAFHSPQETGPVGVAAMRGHGSAKGVVSSTISLHFLEHKCPSGSGKWVADKDNPHRRMVTEGRLPYSDQLVKLDGAAGTWTVIGKFQQALADLQSDDRKGAVIDGLTSGQRVTLEWVVGAMGVWNDPTGATVHQVAACKVQDLNRPPTKSEEENTRKQLRALVKDGLLTETKKGATSKFLPRS